MLTPEERKDASALLEAIANAATKSSDGFTATGVERAIDRLTIAVCVLADVALETGPGSAA